MRYLLFLLTLATVLKAEPPPANYFVLEAPQSLCDLWETVPAYFTMRKHVKVQDDRLLIKWHLFRGLWDKSVRVKGFVEPKEGIIVHSDKTELPKLQACREDLHKSAVTLLKSLEVQYQLSQDTLTLEKTGKYTASLTLWHYFKGSVALAHFDDSILTCIYYRDKGLQLKINGHWVDAPKLEPNQMLVFFGVPGEILSDGNIRALKHRVNCNERHCIVYFYDAPRDYIFPENMNYRKTTMAHIAQDVRLWGSNVNARAVRKLCPATELPWYVVLYGYIAQKFVAADDRPVCRKGQEFSYPERI